MGEYSTFKRRAREVIARQGYRLDLFINDEDPWVRTVVAEEGYGLEILINDGTPGVRAAVAAQGYGLETLINDKSDWVRSVVAEQGYGLETLINDESEWVRAAVAAQGYGLESLINDESERVRAAVAGCGYSLETLLYDPHVRVRISAAKAMIRSDVSPDLKNFSLEDLPFCHKPSVSFALSHYNIETIYDLAHVYSQDLAALQGISSSTMKKFSEELAQYGLSFRTHPYNIAKKQEAEERKVIAEVWNGKNLDIHIKNKDRYVRARIARQGYGLETLINDKDPYVRIAVAAQGYGLETLINDRDPYVRRAVAAQGYGLEILINDENPSVRRAVADQGVGAETLLYDPDVHVRISAAKAMTRRDISPKLKNIYISKLPHLKSRTQSALSIHGIGTIYDLAHVYSEDLPLMEGVGSLTLKEIDSLIDQYGLCLRDHRSERNLIDAMFEYGSKKNWSENKIIASLRKLGISAPALEAAGYTGNANQRKPSLNVQIAGAVAKQPSQGKNLDTQHFEQER